MADKLIPSRDDASVIQRFRDMGDGSWAPVVSVAAGAAGAAGYPAGATPVSATSTGANATTTATLPAAAGKTTYITSLQASAASPTAANLVSVTLTGVLGGPVPLFITAPATPGAVAPLTLNFNPPLPASAVNTAISAAMSAVGTGSATQVVSVQGFQL